MGISIYEFSEFMQAISLKRDGVLIGKANVLFDDAQQCFKFPPNVKTIPCSGDVIIRHDKEYVITVVEEEYPIDDELFAYRA